jgi:hypothetical protein
MFTVICDIFIMCLALSLEEEKGKLGKEEEEELGFLCLFNILITILLTCYSFVIDVYLSIRYFHNVFRFI